MINIKQYIIYLYYYWTMISHVFYIITIFFQDLHTTNPKINSKKPTVALSRSNDSTDDSKPQIEKSNGTKTHPIT